MWSICSECTQPMVRIIDPIYKEIRGYNGYIGGPEIGQSNAISFAVFNREEVSQYVSLVRMYVHAQYYLLLFGYIL